MLLLLIPLRDPPKVRAKSSVNSVLCDAVSVSPFFVCSRIAFFRRSLHYLNGGTLFLFQLNRNKGTYDAEDSRVRSDADRELQHCNQTETRASSQGSDCITHVLTEGIQNRSILAQSAGAKAQTE